MAYETYTTEAIVCGTFNRNTSDRSFILLTREAGMLYADARSIREERSRQRYALQDFSHLKVSLVKGKHGWKIGSIEPITNFYNQAVDKKARGSVVQLVRFLRRFVKGEEAEPRLFEFAIEALKVLVGSVKHRFFVEQVVSVRVLSHLGYVAHGSIPKEVELIEPAEIDKHFSPQVDKEVNAIYTQSVSVSHL